MQPSWECRSCGRKRGGGIHGGYPQGPTSSASHESFAAPLMPPPQFAIALCKCLSAVHNGRRAQ